MACCGVWCIRMHYFTALMREAAALGIRGRGIIPGKCLKFETRNPAFWRLLDSENGLREALLS